MILSDINLISLSNIQNISIQTSQKISPQNRYNFIASSLQLHDISINNSSKIFHSFIEEVNIYEIYIASSQEMKNQIQTNVFAKLCKNTYDLFILEDYFVVYKNKHFYLFKENKTYSVKDIKEYLKFKYKIDVLSEQYISQSKFKECQNDFLNNKSLKQYSFDNLKQSKAYYYYILYIIIISVLTYNSFYNEKQIQIQKPIINLKNNLYINEILMNINKYNIALENIIYNKKYTVYLNSTNKNNLYKFLSIYKKNLQIKSFFKNDKKYFMEIEIDI
jgi:hypothetical protein